MHFTGKVASAIVNAVRYVFTFLCQNGITLLQSIQLPSYNPHRSRRVVNAQRGYMLNVALVIFLNYVASYKNVPSL